MRRDPLIIGAGPAGTAAAITLGRAGCRPVVVERTTGPTDKVCGDFLSIDAIQQVQALGVDPLALGAAPIERIRLIHGKRTVEAALPFPALGLSRRTLDAGLLSEARRSGAVVLAGQTVRRLTRAPLVSDPRASDPLASDAPDRGLPARWLPASDPRIGGEQRRAGAIGMGRHWTAQTGEKTTLIAETVFLATGKHDLRDLPRPHIERGAIGMKMYFALTPEPARTLEGAIELTLFPGGYAGMQHVDSGQTVLCIAVQRGAFQTYGAGWPGLIAAVARHSGRFAAMLAGARALLPRPLAVAGIPYGYQARSGSADGLFRLGDQAAVIPSLTGDGMAIALHSGKTAAETWLAGADATVYHRALTRTLTSQMRLSGLLHHACMSAAVQSMVTRSAALCPSLLHHAACRTRLGSCSGVRPQVFPA